VRSNPVLACLVCSAVAVTGLAPEPDPVPKRWQLALEAGPLRVASVQVPGQGVRSYYFLTYKVTNTTEQDVLFTPIFELGTDNGEILRSGRDVPSVVTADILARLNNPLIQDQIGIVGLLAQGEANAKEGVVIWPVTDHHVTEISIYAAGFSGETRTVEITNARGEKDKIILRKTLMLRYQPPGEIRDWGSRPIELVEKQWIMR
jgi:hypothetical protein